MYNCPLSRCSRKGVFILERFYIVNIIVEDRQAAYRSVNELLHDFAEVIRLRVGYPVPEENMAIILLIVKGTNDVMGNLTGKLGQIKGVRVKSTVIK